MDINFDFSASEYLSSFGKLLVEVNPEIIDISPRLSFLPDKTINILKQTGVVAIENNCNIFLIGGMVRDLLLNKHNTDLDFVVEGNLKQLIPELANELNGKWNYNKKFATGNIRISSNYNLDLATTRREYYPAPGSLPRVEETDIWEDFFRRDYTINALALALTPENFGKLIDVFKGRKDIKNRYLRVLHKKSFKDDPTRIIRGIRLAIKLNFFIEKRTKNLMKKTLYNRDFSALSSERVLKEIRLLFKGKTKDNFLHYLCDIPYLRLLKINHKVKPKYIIQLKQLNNYLAYFRKKHYNIKKWLIKLAIVLQDIANERIEQWNITSRSKRILTFLPLKKKFNILGQNHSSINPVQLHNLLKKLTLEEMILLSLQGDQEQFFSNIKFYLEELSAIDLNINGHDILKLGIEPGPEVKYILDQIWKAKVEEKIISRQEELSYAEKIIKNKFS